MPKLQQSSNWESRGHINYFIEDGFPFDEDWPRTWPGDPAVFEIITRDGQHHKARVDFSTQYRAEGLQWKSLDCRENFGRQVVIAWREIPTNK